MQANDMPSAASRRGLAAIACGVLIAAVALTPLSGSAGAGVASCANADAGPGGASIAQLEAAALCLLNDVRAQAGLPRLKANADLTASAQAHSADMVARKYFSSEAPDGSTPATRNRNGYLQGIPLSSTTEYLLKESLHWGTSSRATPRGAVSEVTGRAEASREVLNPAAVDGGVGIAAGSPVDDRAGALTYTFDVGKRLPKPVPGQSVLAGPVSGVTRYQLPTAGKATAAASRWVTLTSTKLLPIGSSIDVRHGRMRMTVAKNLSGGTASADWFEGAFKITRQANLKNNGLTTDIRLRGGSFQGCPRGFSPKATAAAAKRGRTQVRRLWGRGKGKFRTVGRRGAATVRGTFWLTEDRCNGTFVRVRTGVVQVLDFGLHRVVTVRAGHSYLARIG
jgi:hypothetical protein